jgi:hypothetical protein
MTVDRVWFDDTIMLASDTFKHGPQKNRNHF